MLPHLAGRSCSLVRGPIGVDGQLFLHKHGERTTIAGPLDMEGALWPGPDALLKMQSGQALAGAVQMNIFDVPYLELSREKIDTPDRYIPDLDLGDGTPWAKV